MWRYQEFSAARGFEAPRLVVTLEIRRRHRGACQFERRCSRWRRGLWRRRGAWQLECCCSRRCRGAWRLECCCSRRCRGLWWHRGAGAGGGAGVCGGAGCVWRYQEFSAARGFEVKRFVVTLGIRRRRGTWRLERRCSRRRQSVNNLPFLTAPPTVVPAALLS